MSDKTVPDDVWEAIVSRDRALDGEMFYAVRTTGIYCRPSCPSRRPKRDNVLQFDTPDSAEEAGYRACHRCHPRSATGTTSERRVQLAMKYLQHHRDQPITLEQLGKAVGISPFHLQRKFKEVVGVSPREYQQAQRLEAMRSQLRSGEEVGPAVWAAGYGSMRGAYQAVANANAMTPGQYRRGGNGLRIAYSLHETRFGHVLIASTEKGICAVSLGDDPQKLVADLHKEFPAAAITESAGDHEHMTKVLRSLDGQHSRITLPLDLHGSTFQLRVWKALQQIPVGEVRTYSDIARAIGAPNAVRAVARACATNKVALAVPCHRVIRRDGSMGGYRWGEWRKQQLLELEKTRAMQGDVADY